MSKEILEQVKLTNLIADIEKKKTSLNKIDKSFQYKPMFKGVDIITAGDLLEKFITKIHNIGQKETNMFEQIVMYQIFLEEFKYKEKFAGYRKTLHVHNPYFQLVPSEKLADFSDKEMNNIEFELFIGLIAERLKNPEYNQFYTNPESEHYKLTIESYFSNDFYIDITGSMTNINPLLRGAPKK